jgi:hypothetical protein
MPLQTVANPSNISQLKRGVSGRNATSDNLQAMIGPQYTGGPNGNVIIGQTPQEAAAGVTPVVAGYWPGDIRRYAQPGATDYTQAMVSVASVGGPIFITVPVSFASASIAALPTGGIELFSGTRIIGIPGMPVTITGTTPCNVFVSTDISNIEFIDFFCIGNSAGTGTLGYFWYSTHTAAATQDATNIRYIRGGLQNFAGYYWGYFDNTASTGFAVTNVIVEGGQFNSEVGNNQGQTNIEITATVWGFSGSDTATGFYTIKDCHVRDCFSDGTYIKNFVTFWSGTLRCSADDNNLVGFGTDSGTSDDTACYALQAYDHSHGAGLPPEEVSFDRNTIDQVRDAGVYFAGCNRYSANDNTITGQTSVADTETPKGAIAVNQCQYGTLNDNTIFDSAIAVSLVLGAGDVVELNNTGLSDTPASGVGVLIAPSGTGLVGDVIIDGMRVDTPNAGVTCVQLNSSSTLGIANFAMRNFRLNSPANGLVLFDTTGGADVPQFGTLHVSNGEIVNCSNVSLLWSGASNSATSATFENLVFSGAAGNVTYINVANSTGLTVRAITFVGMTSGTGVCWRGDGAQGRVEGIQYVDCAAANRYYAGSLGLAIPTGWGANNDYVENLNRTVTGSGGFGTANQKQWTWGWGYDETNAGWAPDVRLTGA